MSGVTSMMDHRQLGHRPFFGPLGCGHPRHPDAFLGLDHGDDLRQILIQRPRWEPLRLGVTPGAELEAQTAAVRAVLRSST